MKNKSDIIFIIVSIFVLVIITISSYYYYNKENKKEKSDIETDFFNAVLQESKEVKNKKDFNKINVDQYLELYNGSKDAVVLVGQDGCQYCDVAEPIIQGIMYDNNIEVNYLLTNDFTEETESKFMNSNERLKSFSTPLLLIVSNGEIKDEVDSLMHTEDYIKFFKDNNIIN